LSQFSPARDSWYGYDVSLRRHFERGSLALEWLGAHRFRSNDYAWALDGYVGLWARAYANLRYQMSPQASLFPERSWRVEVFQGVGHGWEPSVSYDRLDFTNSSVDIYGVGLGKYVGNFYLRVLSRYVPGVGSGSLSHRGLIRYYYAGNGDDYAEINGGSGRSSSELPRRGIIRNSSTSVGIAFVKYLTPHWGFKLGADYGDDTGGFVERGVSAAVYTRW
jgi:YaiO family outer membrane protein